MQFIERGVIELAMMSDIASFCNPARAYIQLCIEPQQVRAAAELLCTYGEIASVGPITGRFDIIALVVLPTLRDLPDFMAERIAPCPASSTPKPSPAPTWSKPSPTGVRRWSKVG